MPNDLTWRQLRTAIGNDNAITLVAGKIQIDPALITGDDYDSLDDGGVIETLHKLLGVAYQAQTTANQGVSTGQRLNSLGATSYGAIVQDSSGSTVTATRAITVITPLDENNITGTNV